MRTFFTLIFSLLLSLKSYCQSLCGTVDEGQTLTMTAPAGTFFISVTFASYGTPNGSCGSFTIGGCHATNSQSIVEAALLGRNSGSISANNGVFGDPCGGTFKRLYVEAIYSVVTPLQLLFLTGSPKGEDNLLQWQTTNEVNTQEFVIERSADGIQFTQIGVVKSNNRIETNKYSYPDNLFNNETSFYRLKMIDSDGSFEYSKIVAIRNETNRGFRILANPVSTMLTLNHLGSGWVELINLQGEVLQKIKVKGQALHLDVSSYNTGIYFIRYFGEKRTEVHKIVKQ
jgi:hypothetical protein